jgi:type IX secretion system PorP/SprF family membrane protein
MKVNIRLFFYILMILPFSKAQAQDPVFTQYMLVPETINPAFTGVANAWNAGILNRRQWPDADRRMDTRFGYANFMATDQLAVGGTILNHHEDFTSYNFFQLNGAVSYRVELDYEWRLRMGLEAGVGYKNFNFRNLLLEDQINPNDGSIGGGSVDPGVLRRRENVFFPDFSVGVVIDKEEMWFGAGLRHIARPNISFTDEGNVPLDMFLTLHGGYYLTMERPFLSFLPDDSDLFFTFNYMRQSEYNRLDIGTFLEMPMFSFGVMAATNPQRKSSNSHFITSVNPILSMKMGEFTFGYSYDANTSKIGRTQGVHELTFTWQSNHTCNKCDNYKVKLKRNGEAGYTH